MAERADVYRHDRSPCSLDAADHFRLDGERANQAIEVRDDDHVDLSASTISTARRRP